MLYRLVLFAGLALLNALSAFAQDFVVIEASKDSYRPGHTLAVGDRVALAQGTHLTLISSSGQVIRLRGPHDGQLAAPSKKPAAPRGALASLSDLLSRATRKTASIGATREADEASNAAPIPAEAADDIWAVDADSGATACIAQGPTRLFRRNAEAQATVTLWPLDGPERRIDWAPSDPTLSLEGLASGDQLRITTGPRSAAIVLWRLPAGIDPASPGSVLLWMGATGCQDQATRLAARIAAAPDQR